MIMCSLPALIEMMSYACQKLRELLKQNYLCLIWETMIALLWRTLCNDIQNKNANPLPFGNPALDCASSSQSRTTHLSFVSPEKSQSEWKTQLLFETNWGRKELQIIPEDKVKGLTKFCGGKNKYLFLSLSELSCPNQSSNEKVIETKNVSIQP